MDEEMCSRFVDFACLSDIPRYDWKWISFEGFLISRIIFAIFLYFCDFNCFFFNFENCGKCDD